MKSGRGAIRSHSSGTLQDAPDTPLSGALEMLHEHGVEVPLMSEKGRIGWAMIKLFTPAIDATFLAQNWKVVESLKTKKVFNIRFEFPTTLGKCFDCSLTTIWLRPRLGRTRTRSSQPARTRTS